MSAACGPANMPALLEIAPKRVGVCQQSQPFLVSRPNNSRYGPATGLRLCSRRFYNAPYVFGETLRMSSCCKQTLLGIAASPITKAGEKICVMFCLRI